MNPLSGALTGGAVGALTTNFLHEITRRVRPDAPRVDLLGMQALAKMLEAAGIEPPTGAALYRTTLVADLLTNAAYFALAALAPQGSRTLAGTAIGLAAGIGAVRLPPRIGLTAPLTSRTPVTSALSVALYTLGGLAAGRTLDRQAATGIGGSFDGTHVVVTGGSRGLGLVLARRLLEAGARVTLCGRSTESLAFAQGELAGHGTYAPVALACDVRDRTECERFIAEAIERQGPIDMLVNNAAVIEVGPAVEQTLDDYREAMETHFWGPLYLMRAVLPAMRARGSGRIVNVASIGGVIGVPHLAPYSASKFAQVGLTQAFGAEFAGDGIGFTSVVPGLMITGSPERAIFKGRTQAEYAWFALSDGNPLVAVGAETAARRILRAVQRGQSTVVIGSTARLAQLANAIVPQTTAAVLRLAARLLPRPGGIGTGRSTGDQNHSVWTQNPLTYLNTLARRRYQPPSAPPLEIEQIQDRSSHL